MNPLIKKSQINGLNFQLKMKGLHMPYKISIQIVSCLLFLGVSVGASAKPECSRSQGALIIAHGAHKHGPHHLLPRDVNEFNEGTLAGEDWNEVVNASVREAKKKLAMPLELVFGMWDKTSFEIGVNKLASQRVCELIIIPLFVSSDSEVIDIQKYMFGLNEHFDYPLHVEKVRLPRSIKSVKFKGALDTHQFVTDILVDRLSEISVDPTHEGVIFVAHGPYGDRYESNWTTLLRTHGQRIQKYFYEKNKVNFDNFVYLNLRDDAPSNVQNDRTQQLRDMVTFFSNRKITPIIIPVLLAPGGIEKGIFERLRGLDYKIQNKFLMPHSRIADWIVESAKSF